MRAVNASQLQALCEIALAAGDEIMRVYAGAAGTVTKADGSPLTEADLRADRVIVDGLRKLFPTVPIVSEESSPVIPAGNGPFFLVDPLDGTREFVARNGEFTVNIAFIEDGEPVAGVVGVPALGELFCASRGHGAWWSQGRGEPVQIRVAPAAAGQPLRVLGSRNHRRAETQAWLSTLARRSVVEPLGSSLKFCRIAQGRADLYPRLGPTSQWDTAAGQAVLCEAGGAVRFSGSHPPRYGAHRSLINPSFVAMADPSWDLPPLP